MNHKKKLIITGIAYTIAYLGVALGVVAIFSIVLGV